MSFNRRPIQSLSANRRAIFEKCSFGNVQHPRPGRSNKGGYYYLPIVPCANFGKMASGQWEECACLRPSLSWISSYHNDPWWVIYLYLFHLHSNKGKEYFSERDILQSSNTLRIVRGLSTMTVVIDYAWPILNALFRNLNDESIEL